MALAVSAPTLRTRSASQTQAATWTAISAAISLLATIPLVWILSNPLSQLMFVRGSEQNGSWGYVFMIALILTAPATYALFFGTAGELLKPQVSPTVHKSTMRIAALGIVPYFVMITVALYWDSGPQVSLLLSAGLTIPIAMVTTVWASARQH
jgi:hypothetical protein